MSDTAPFQMETDRNLVIVTILPQMISIPWADIEQVGTQVTTQVQALTAPKVVVDLTPLDYMGSAQVALIVRIFKIVKDNRGTMVVVNQHPIVQEVLTLAGLNKLWTIVRTRDEGLERLGVPLVRRSAGQGRLSAWLGLTGVLVASAALAAIYTHASWWPERTAVITALAASAIGFASGLIAALRGQGSSRSLGTGVLLAGVVLLMAAVFTLASPPDQLVGRDPGNEPAHKGPAATRVTIETPVADRVQQTTE